MIFVDKTYIFTLRTSKQLLFKLFFFIKKKKLILFKINFYEINTYNDSALIMIFLISK